MATVKISASRNGLLADTLVQLFTSIFPSRRRKRRTTQHRLSLSNDEQLALIGSMSNLGFWSLDLTTGEFWASPQSRKILGLEETVQLQRDSFLAIIHEHDRANLIAAISAASSNREAGEIEVRVVGADPPVHWVTVKVGLASNGQSALPRIAGYIVDEAQYKRAASELVTLQQKLSHLTRVALLGELSGALAHELQQPLTAILANAQAAQLLANRSPVDSTELKDILREIVNDDKRAGQIITSLRALLMRAETQFQRVDVEGLIKDVLSLAHGTLMERNVQVHTRFDEGLPATRGNRVELKQVLLNLVLNACDAMIANPARDRQIEIVVSHEDVVIQVSVLDCGRGIKAEQMRQVFEPFFTTKENGLGLGLAISHSIVIAHGGRLWASNRPDRGTAFHFTLPIAAPDLDRSC
jgi:C4-dicarboxylate-specific signal transduction histidine kinase